MHSKCRLIIDTIETWETDTYRFIFFEKIKEGYSMKDQFQSNLMQILVYNIAKKDGKDMYLT